MPVCGSGLREAPPAETTLNTQEGERRKLRLAIQGRIDSDPWFARRFTKLLRAGAIEKPIELYVFIGDDNLQGSVTSSGLNGPDQAFNEELIRLLSINPEGNNTYEVLVLNCSLAGSVLSQWISPSDALGASLSDSCIQDIDAISDSARASVTLRGIVIDLGANDARLANQRQQWAVDWTDNLEQLIDIYRAGYETNVGVILARLPGTGVGRPYYDAWRSLRNAQVNYENSNTVLVDTDGIDSTSENGAPPRFSPEGQAEFGRRLAVAAFELLPPH